jgi:dolichol-phosphate mannosyltransferase
MNIKKRKQKISFVIPIYNEEENIKPLCKELIDFFDSHKNYNFEAILVENGSYDNSYNLLEKVAKEDKRIKVLQLAKNELGDGGMAAGMNYIDGEACVLMMGDLQEPIEIVDKFIKKWNEGFDIVYGIVKKRTANWFININSIIFYKIMSLATNNDFPENVSDFRLIDKKVYKTINNMPEKHKYLRGLVIWTGFSHIGVSFNRRPRKAGTSKATINGLMKVALNGIFSFSYLPLKFVSFLGLLITILSFVGLVINLVLLIMNGRQTPGIATVILLMFTLFGILFFIIGILSEYISRIYEEVKRRPNYIIKKTLNLPPQE